MRTIGRFFRKDGLEDVDTGLFPAKYRCVEVIAGNGSCAAALGIAGRRFFPDEIPSLPLDGCDAGECRCSYELRDDRRGTPRSGKDVE